MASRVPTQPVRQKGFRAKRPRVEVADHLAFIRQLPCACCGKRLMTEAAHLRASDLSYGKRYTGKGEKPSDRWALPLCSQHHREQHAGAELEFWNRVGVNPFVLALTLWGCSGDVAMGDDVVMLARRNGER